MLVAPLVVSARGPAPGMREYHQVVQEISPANVAESMAPYESLLQSANQALASGEFERAAEQFEQAARVNDSTPEAEIGMVRAYLQAGEYRKALAVATLVAGEHPGSPEAEAFLAWVEFIGGQRDFATSSSAPQLLLRRRTSICTKCEDAFAP